MIVYNEHMGVEVEGNQEVRQWFRDVIYPKILSNRTTANKEYIGRIMRWVRAIVDEPDSKWDEFSEAIRYVRADFGIKYAITWSPEDGDDDEEESL